MQGENMKAFIHAAEGLCYHWANERPALFLMLAGRSLVREREREVEGYG